MRSDTALWRRPASIRATLVTLVVVGHAWLGGAPSAHAQQSQVDPRRSLAVTDQPILERFPLQRVLDQLVAQSGVPGLTSLALFRQWWDTQNPGPGLGRGPNCDDRIDMATGKTTLNTFPYECREDPAEGGEVADARDPFSNTPDGYMPIGLFNRFDVAPADGSHCGEHRIVYARRSGQDASVNNRNFLIFEATLPNPLPQQGLRGCFLIAKFWADLSQESSIVRRADALERFYFRGAANIPPVVHVNHFGDNALDAGQIRTNQFMQDGVEPTVWTLREFKLRRTCTAGRCTALRVMPVTNKENPFGPLFSATGMHPRTEQFWSHFVGHVTTLAARTVPDITFNGMDDRYNSGQSQASGSEETDYAVHFGTGPSPLREDIQAALNALGSSLTPDDIVARAQALSCAGCHRLSRTVDLGGGLIWPNPLGFTHVSERATETTPDGVTRFQISEALTTVFLPKRKQVLEDFLNNRPVQVRSPRAPIGGRRVH